MKSVYKQRTGNFFEDSDYESFGIVNEVAYLTNAGALLADESPVNHSRLFCTRWNGLDKASGIVDAVDDKEYSGGLITLLQAGIEFVTNNSKKAWKKVSDGRIEMPDYPERVVLEELVNALIHRSYLQSGSEVHIDMFDNLIEIYSPGGMIGGTSLKDKDIMKIPSKRRNPVLADIFNRLKHMERRGSGFKKIIMDYQEQQNYSEKLKPLFEADNEDFLDDKIKVMIKENRKISTEEIANVLGVSTRTIKRHIKDMEDIIFVGSGYSGYWDIRNED